MVCVTGTRVHRSGFAGEVRSELRPELGEVKTMVDSGSSWVFLHTLRVVVRLVRVSVR